MGRRLPLAFAALLTLTAIAAAAGQFADLSADLVREPAIAYFTTPASDRIARLNADLQRGAATLTFDPVQGHLPSVLEALGVPASSQLLLFTKSSVQASRINPRNPRAIYFDDTVSLGFIHGAEFLEFAALDPRQGIVFYTLDQRAVEKPVIERPRFLPLVPRQPVDDRGAGPAGAQHRDDRVRRAGAEVRQLHAGSPDAVRRSLVRLLRDGSPRLTAAPRQRDARRSHQRGARDERHAQPRFGQGSLRRRSLPLAQTSSRCWCSSTRCT